VLQQQAYATVGADENETAEDQFKKKKRKMLEKVGSEISLYSLVVVRATRDAMHSHFLYPYRVSLYMHYGLLTCARQKKSPTRNPEPRSRTRPST
jgi:hypothetical protein